MPYSMSSARMSIERIFYGQDGIVRKERKCDVRFSFLKFPRWPVKSIYLFPKRQLLRTKRFAPHLNGTFIVSSSFFFFSFCCFPVFLFHFPQNSLNIVQHLLKFWAERQVAVREKRSAHQGTPPKYLCCGWSFGSRAARQTCVQESRQGGVCRSARTSLPGQTSPVTATKSDRVNIIRTAASTGWCCYQLSNLI